MTTLVAPTPDDLSSMTTLELETHGYIKVINGLDAVIKYVGKEVIATISNPHEIHKTSPENIVMDLCGGTNYTSDISDMFFRKILEAYRDYPGRKLLMEDELIKIVHILEKCHHSDVHTILTMISQKDIPSKEIKKIHQKIGETRQTLRDYISYLKNKQ